MPHRQKGFTLIEVLIVVAIILIIAGMAIPKFERAKISTNEAATLQLLDTLNTACSAYQMKNEGYPPTLTSLGPALETTPAGVQGWTDLVGSGSRDGYVFRYVPGPTDSKGNAISYTITAVPISPGITGQRSFFTDDSGPIRVSQNGTPTAASTPLN